MIKYDDIVDYYKIDLVYQDICKNIKHKDKLVYFEMDKFSNFIYIYKMLDSRMYTHGKYNIFMIKYPKYRIIMSENLIDKIVDHLIKSYILSPLIEPKLLDVNVATRSNKGIARGVYDVKRYLNILKNNYSNVYILKCDISNYFYNIDHEILLMKLKKIISDKEIFEFIKHILNSTNEKYVNREINHLILKESQKVKSSKIHFNNKEKLLKNLKQISKYESGKGLAAGNVTSQLLAIFYLNDFDHFIKEKLKIKYYVRYMDDFILFHEDREYLKFCKREIMIQLQSLKLSLNNKTLITELRQGFVFMGYRFINKNNRLYILPSQKIKKKIAKRVKKDGLDSLKKYDGYLKMCKSSQYTYFLSKKYKD